jgi:hypothetical protein
MPTRFSGGAMVPGRALMMTNVTPPLVRLTVGNGKAEIVGRGPMSAMLKERTADVAGTTVREIRGIFLGGARSNNQAASSGVLDLSRIISF